MAPQRRARIAFSDAAAKQLEGVTSEADIRALDRALLVVSVDPEVGEALPGDTSGPRLRQYTDDIERVRLLYWVTALRTVVVVAYIEVCPVCRSAGWTVGSRPGAACRCRRWPRQRWSAGSPASRWATERAACRIAAMVGSSRRFVSQASAHVDGDRSSTSR